ncbi:MAG: molecular chaperone [Acidobacteriota bacterium]|nr:molecular chaperone [Acidobacteriota bacterium]
MRKKEFLINAVRMVEVDGSNNIPTALFYAGKGRTLIGSAAIAATTKSRHHLNEDFKIDLGNIDPTSSAPKRLFPTADGEKKSAAALTGDFLHELLRHTREWLEDNGITKSANILLAEPLAMQTDLASSEWLSNYRRNLQRILSGKGFENIDFLPEPFAVFQYYRYGHRHPIVAERTKHHALVIDFGGGTFDVCIIETTKEGDISQSGRNSRPLAASSEPVGGFFINRMMAEELFRKYVIQKPDGAKFRKGLELYNNWRRNQIDLSTVSDEYRNFIENFHASIYALENPKIIICNSVVDWSLDATLSLTVPIVLPENPFSPTSNSINIQLSAADLRDVFVNKVWKLRLKSVIGQALQRGKEELSGASISVVLLSGGSANMRWLGELLQQDFAGELSHAEVLRIPNFQEVVAKGLAVECARRFYNQDGDFSSVTYNRLCLILDADSSGQEVRPFKSRTNALPNVTDLPGVLLPSASVLKNFIDKPMRWKVRLDRPPHRQLDYYFLRSSFNPNDIENLQNVEEHIVYTPRGATFDANLQVQLLVRQDGTAIPKFVYKSGQTESEEKAAEGKPFYLDMTYNQAASGATAYVGLDFGTSNTSVSFVDASSVEIYRARSADASWMELSDLVSVLPYPLAAPLASYLGQSDQSRLVAHAMEFVEAALAVAAYVTYFDYCIHKGRAETKLFKNFTQRSAGPLWALLKDGLKQLGNHADISAPYKELLSPELHRIVDDVVTFLAQLKHGKASVTSVDTLRPVQILANISHKIFADNHFGFFEQVRKQKFAKEYQGLFRQACGSLPFIKILPYRGPEAFSEDEPFLFNSDIGKGVSLQPLIFWDKCPKHPDIDNHCFLYDKPEKEEGSFSFKAVAFPCTCEVSLTNQYSALAERLMEFRQADPKIDSVDIGGNTGEISEDTI